MKYGHVLSYVVSVPWAILPVKLQEIVAVLAHRAAGETLTPAEIRARLEAARSREPASVASDRRVAVIPMRGVLAHRMGLFEESSGGSSAEGIGRALHAAAADPSVETIVYDVDSPGGTVPGIQELAADMYALRGKKRQIAQVNSLAASAAYWLATQADEIVSTPSGSVGSIGVFAVHEDLSAALEQEGVKVTLVSAGRYKLEGNPLQALSEEGLAVMQQRVAAAYAQFVSDVARGRGVPAATVTAGYGEGRVLSASDAMAAGLIDRIATMDETLRAVTQARSAPPDLDQRARRLRLA